MWCSYCISISTCHAIPCYVMKVMPYFGSLFFILEFSSSSLEVLWCLWIIYLPVVIFFCIPIALAWAIPWFLQMFSRSLDQCTRTGQFLIFFFSNMPWCVLFKLDVVQWICGAIQADNVFMVLQISCFFWGLVIGSYVQTCMGVRFIDRKGLRQEQDTYLHKELYQLENDLVFYPKYYSYMKEREYRNCIILV